MDTAGPIVKWVGGKTRLLSELRARAPKKFGTYFEPFLGGGALFFALAPEKAILGDMNEALINTYRTVASCVEPVIKRLEVHRREHGKAGYYYEIRDWWNDHRHAVDDIAAAAAFIYLNKTCFNGLWRVNREGEFNVPRGDYKDPKVFDPEALRTAAAVLSRAQLMHGPYARTVDEARPGDFVYFDPPYDPVSKTSNFTSYTKDAFGKKEQEQLRDTARGLRDRGVNVMLSNNDTEYVRALYSDFCIDNVKCGRSINSKGDKRGAVDEVIITTYNSTN